GSVDRRNHHLWSRVQDAGSEQDHETGPRVPPVDVPEARDSGRDFLACDIQSQLAPEFDAQQTSHALFERSLALIRRCAVPKLPRDDRFIRLQVTSIRDLIFGSEPSLLALCVRLILIGLASIDCRNATTHDGHKRRTLAGLLLNEIRYALLLVSLNIYQVHVSGACPLPEIELVDKI